MATHISILPGKSNGRRSLAGYSPWGHKESDAPGRLNMLAQAVAMVCWPADLRKAWNIALGFQDLALQSLFINNQQS